MPLARKASAPNLLKISFALRHNTDHFARDAAKAINCFRKSAENFGL